MPFDIKDMLYELSSDEEEAPVKEKKEKKEPQEIKGIKPTAYTADPVITKENVPRDGENPKDHPDIKPSMMTLPHVKRRETSQWKPKRTYFEARK